jgi:hypothetical protein
MLKKEPRMFFDLAVPEIPHMDFQCIMYFKYDTVLQFACCFSA